MCIGYNRVTPIIDHAATAKVPFIHRVSPYVLNIEIYLKEIY